MTECNCPVVPDLSQASVAELAKIIGAPLKCLSCGQELELRCPKGHVHEVPRAPHSPNPRRDIGVPRGPTPMHWKPNPCGDCGKKFKPNGGRDVRCTSCKAKREATS